MDLAQAVIFGSDELTRFRASISKFVLVDEMERYLSPDLMEISPGL